MRVDEAKTEEAIDDLLSFLHCVDVLFKEYRLEDRSSLEPLGDARLISSAGSKLINNPQQLITLCIELPSIALCNRKSTDGYCA